MNAYTLINLGYAVLTSTDEELLIWKAYKSGAVFVVRCDLITTGINNVKKVK